MGRLIDADICLNKAWQNFYKQEAEHEKNIDNYDIMRDRFYEQSGFECCQQTIVNAPTVEAITKDQYKARLNADLKAILVELQLEIKELWDSRYDVWLDNQYYIGKSDTLGEVDEIIQQKINAL